MTWLVVFGDLLLCALISAAMLTIVWLVTKESQPMPKKTDIQPDPELQRFLDYIDGEVLIDLASVMEELANVLRSRGFDFGAAHIISASKRATYEVSSTVRRIVRASTRHE